jgi:hypothetical protein
VGAVPKNGWLIPKHSCPPVLKRSSHGINPPFRSFDVFPSSQAPVISQPSGNNHVPSDLIQAGVIAISEDQALGGFLVSSSLTHPKKSE